MNWKTANPIETMMFHSYEQWYRENVSSFLSAETKEALLKKLSDYSLEHPITQAGIKVSKKEFPELAKFSNTSEFSGFQLYTVFVLLFEELHGKSNKNISIKSRKGR